MLICFASTSKAFLPGHTSFSTSSSRDHHISSSRTIVAAAPEKPLMNGRWIPIAYNKGARQSSSSLSSSSEDDVLFGIRNAFYQVDDWIQDKVHGLYFNETAVLSALSFGNTPVFKDGAWQKEGVEEEPMGISVSVGSSLTTMREEERSEEEGEKRISHMDKEQTHNDYDSDDEEDEEDGQEKQEQDALSNDMIDFLAKNADISPLPSLQEAEPSSSSSFEKQPKQGISRSDRWSEGSRQQRRRTPSDDENDQKDQKTDSEPFYDEESLKVESSMVSGLRGKTSHLFVEREWNG